MKKILVLILSLALVAGLFVFFFEKRDTKEPEKEVIAEEIEENSIKEEDLFIVPKSGWDIQSLSEAVSGSIKISEEEGLLFSYSQPDIPNELHLSVKFQIFDEKGATLERYVSDAGYLSDPKNYNSKEGYVEKQMKTDSLKGNMAIVSVIVKNENGNAYVYQTSIHYDGSRTVEHALRGDK